MFKKIKESWENIWLPRIQEGKTKIELERDKHYETDGFGIILFLL